MATTINAVSNFAKARAYTVSLTIEDEVVGKIELVTSNIDYTMDRIKNYLASGVPLRGSVEDALAWYRGLDHIDIGASRQLVRLDEEKARSLILSMQADLRQQEATDSNSTSSSESLDQTEYWDGINLGDSLSTAIKKSKNGAKQVEPAIYQLLGGNYIFDSRNIMVLDDKVEGLLAVKYFSCQMTRKELVDAMSSMLPFVKETLFGNRSMTLLNMYADDSSLTGDDDFVAALQQGELTYGYWPSDGSPSPFFHLTADDDDPDRLIAMAAIMSETATEAMT